MLPIGFRGRVLSVRSQIGTAPLFILAASAQDAERLTGNRVVCAEARVNPFARLGNAGLRSLVSASDLTSRRVATLHQFLHGAFDIGHRAGDHRNGATLPEEYVAGRSFSSIGQAV